MEIIKEGQIRRHYKSTGGDNHTYRIIGLAKHSENEETLIIYQPLFDAESTWLGESKFAARPLKMWFDEVIYNSKSVPRFSLV